MRYEVTEEYIGTRIDSYVALVTELSRSAAVRHIECGDITVSGVSVSKKYTLCDGDTVEISIPEAAEYEVVAEDIPLSIIYEDDDLIVINKPAGMVVHPAPGNHTGTLVNALLHHCRDSLSGVGGVMRPGIVHRIDKDTSGLLVVAKNDRTHRALSEELSYHGIEREYRALVRGGFREGEGRVDLPIGRHPVDRKRMAVLTAPGAHAKHAVTHYTVLEQYGEVSYLALRLETGRTHQIRVHMSHLGHPLLGDGVYSKSATRFEKAHPALFDGQMLHALRLTFTHPTTGVRMTFDSALPENFEKALRLLREDG